MSTKQKVLSTQQYEIFKKNVLNNTVFKQPVFLKDINIIDTQTIEIKGRSIFMTSKAMSQLMSVIGLPAVTTSSLIGTIGTSSTINIANILKTTKDKTIIVGKGSNKRETQKSIAAIIDKNEGMIVGFSTSMKQIMPNSIYIETLEKLMDNNKDMQIVHANMSSEGIQVNMRNPKWEFNIGDNKDEDFWAGLSYISIDEGVFIDQYLERLVCENGMTYKNKNSSIECRQEELVGPFIQAVNRLKSTTTMAFQTRIEKYKEIYASVAEVGQTYQFMKTLMNDKDYALPTLKNLIPVDEIKKTFREQTGINNVFSAPEAMQSKLISPLKYWDLINDVTYFSSHYENISGGGSISPNNRNALMAYAGNMVNTNPDFFMPIKQVYGLN